MRVKIANASSPFWSSIRAWIAGRLILWFSTSIMFEPLKSST